MKFINVQARLHLFACILLISGSICTHSKADHVKGIMVPRVIASHKSRLELNGTAVRSKWGFNVYVVALYLTEQAHNAELIMSNRDPKRIHITMLHSVSKKRFVSTIEKNIAVNFSSEENVKFDAHLKAFMACFHGGTSLRKYSTIDIDYLPNEGMQVSVDGKNFEIIPDDDFYHAIMRLWIGDPPQASLKTGLVGKD